MVIQKLQCSTCVPLVIKYKNISKANDHRVERIAKRSVVRSSKRIAEIRNSIEITAVTLTNRYVCMHVCICVICIFAVLGWLHVLDGLVCNYLL